ncbi:MAG: amino acid permease [Parvularculaceae bacterium]|nr:amino acid permease [Parvularculaceae bacterium]
MSGENPPPVGPVSGFGFWKCWAMSAGVMIGSGVFLLPAVLAPYGAISFLGWLLSSFGAIFIALTLGRLAGRKAESGGFYVYARDAFGGLAGYLMGWSYWLSSVFAISAISIAFAGYAGAVIPGLAANKAGQAATAIAIVWLLTSVNIRGVSAAASAQLATAVLKIAPLLVISALGLFAGDGANVPPFNPQGAAPLEAIASTALLTMWAFIGIEAGVIPAGEIVDARRTIPRAVIAATLSVAAIYIAATAAVMLLVPTQTLIASEAPFVDAAARLGAIGGPMIALGAIISTAGALNGTIMMAGQMPAAAARDGLAPARFGRVNAGHAPVDSLILSSGLGTFFIAFNYSEGLLAAFTFLISMSTLSSLLPYAVSALAEIKHSARKAPGWAGIALVALAFAIVAMAGAGFRTLAWGAALIALGAPAYFAGRHIARRQAAG